MVLIWVTIGGGRYAGSLGFDLRTAGRDSIIELCPNCGKNIPEGGRVESGVKAEGGFCSLDCYAEYYEAELIERAEKIAGLAARHRNS
jgi:hypothetical protein